MDILIANDSLKQHLAKRSSTTQGRVNSAVAWAAQELLNNSRYNPHNRPESLGESTNYLIKAAPFAELSPADSERISTGSNQALNYSADSLVQKSKLELLNAYITVLRGGTLRHTFEGKIDSRYISLLENDKKVGGSAMVTGMKIFLGRLSQETIPFDQRKKTLDEIMAKALKESAPALAKA